MQLLINEFRRELANLSNPLGQIYFFQIPVLMIDTGGATNPGGSTYSYRITGSERNIVDRSALQLEKLLKKNNDFVAVRTNIQDDTPQLKVKILRNKAYLLGLSVEQIERAVNLAFSRGKVADYIVGTEKYNVYLQLENRFSDSISTMSQIYIRSSTTNKLIPLSSVIRLRKTVGPESIVHYNQLNTATLSFSLNKGIPLSKATAVVKALAHKAFPANVGGSFMGHAEQFLKTMDSLLIMIIIAILLLYVLMGILYESFVQPITVLSTLPISIIGGLGFLLIFGANLSLFAYIGMFLLIGITVKNGIMIVDFANQKMFNENKKPLEAIHEACIIRFRPILMTGLTAIAAALPLAVAMGADAAIRRPLGLVIVGGLILSQILTLYITPCIFIYMQRIQDRYLNKFKITRSFHLREKK